MKRSLQSDIRLKGIIVAFALMLFAHVAVEAAYCSFSAVTYSSTARHFINMVEFNSLVVQKWDAPRDANGKLVANAVPYPASSTYPYSYKNIVAANLIPVAERNKTYNIRIHGGASALVYNASSTLPEQITPTRQYAEDYHVYIDYDQSGTFETSERVWYYDAPSTAVSGTTNITIPSTAKVGRTTMRVVCDYYLRNGSYLKPCGQGTYNGEARDFYIDIITGYDAGISRISAPLDQITAGLQPVKVMLKNYGTYAAPITKCKINWTIDGVSQPTYDWTGSLDPGAETEVTLGDYDFKSKGIKTTYTITAVTSLPNDEPDGKTTNDASPTLIASIPLTPQIYYIGGSGANFATLKDMTDYVNLAGIFGDGNVTVRIRPGTYTGPFVMDNFKHGQNNFIFETDPANPGEVKITAATNSSNYVWYINNIPNVTFKKMIFSVTDPSNYGGRIFMLRGNIDNYTFENNTFNGLTTFQPTLYKYSMIECQATQMNNHKYARNIFNDGYVSLSLINSSLNSTGLLVEENQFKTFTNRAIHVEGIADAVISTNLLEAGPAASYGGIFVINGSTIKNNTISGINGINTSAAGISVLHNVVTAPAIITGNKIANCNSIIGISATGITGGQINNNTINLLNSNLNVATSGISLFNSSLKTNKVTLLENTITVENSYGIDIDNYTADLLKNKIVVTNASSKVTLKGISATGSNGMVLLNEVSSIGEAMEIDNSNFTVAYNSILALGSADAMTFENGNNQVYRNQIVNKGTGKAFFMTSMTSAVLNANNYYAISGSLGTINGTSYANISELLAVDNNSRSIDPKYKTTKNLKITEFFDELAFNSPLQNVNWPAGYQTTYEEMTKDGKSREGVYYVGAYNIFPVVEILAYSEELIECSGAENQSISIAATTSEGAEPKYQWYKDGILIPGENARTLNFTNFDYTVSGSYTCQAYAAGAKSKMSGLIPVYALTIPTIVEQPKEVINAVVGNEYSFKVKVHYSGIIPPYYKDAFQWYKYDVVLNDSIPLSNNDQFEGTNSSDFNIRNLTTADICKPGDFYFVKVAGQCGTVYSDPFVISETPEIVFRDQPEILNPCPGADVVFTANAIPPQGFDLTYKWIKDGVDLTNNVKYNGVNTNKLQIFDIQPTDLGNYVCEASIPEVPTSKNSNPGTIVLKDIPEANPVGETVISTKRGNDVTMIVELVKGTEPIMIKWYYKDELIKEGTWSAIGGDELLTLLLEGVNENQAGEYKCAIENECNTTEILFNLTVTKWDETSVEVISENGYALYTCMPNPSNGSTKIRFEMPKTDNAVITLIDQTGRTVSTLFNGIANQGLNVLDVNTESLNITNGVYIYTITTNGFSASLPMVIVK